MLNLNDLLTVCPPSRLATFSDLVGRVKRRKADLLILRGLMANLLSRTGEASFNLKDLLTVRPPSRLATFPGLAGRLRHGKADLLILRGLMANLLIRRGEGLLNLKDLLTVSVPSPECLFENAHRFGAAFVCRIAANPAIFCQNVTEYGRKSGFFTTDFRPKTGRLGAVGGTNPVSAACHPERSEGSRFGLTTSRAKRDPSLRSG